MNDTMKAIKNRKSVRVFEQRDIQKDIQAELFEAAFQAPTAGNQMMYTILNITDPDKKQALSVLCDNQPFIATAPLVLVFLADCRRWLDAYKAAGLDPRAPGQGDVLLAMQDALIAAQNMVVAAESFGIGSCYIGDILEHCEDARELLALPPEVMPATMLVLGYPTDAQKARNKPIRFSGEHIVQENSYHTLSADDHRAMYMDREARGGRNHKSFEESMEAFWKRKYESDFSLEMSRSASAYLRCFETYDLSDDAALLDG